MWLVAGEERQYLAFRSNIFFPLFSWKISTRWGKKEKQTKKQPLILHSIKERKLYSEFAVTKIQILQILF